MQTPFKRMQRQSSWWQHQFGIRSWPEGFGEKRGISQHCFRQSGQSQVQSSFHIFRGSQPASKTSVPAAFVSTSPVTACEPVSDFSANC